MLLVTFGEGIEVTTFLTMKSVTYLFLLIILTHSIDAKSWHREMTVEVAAGKEDCYFLPDIKADQSIELEFQVVSSNAQTGKLDITAFLKTPSGSTLWEEYMKEEGNYQMHEEKKEEGDYKVCFSNQMSTWSDKTVYFEVEVTDPDDDYDDYIDSEEMEEMRGRNEDTEKMFEMKVEDIKTSIHQVRTKVGKMRHFQWMLGAFMSKDINQVESNMEKINLWSIVHLTIMLVVGFLQVFMVRQLFEDKSVLYKLVGSKK